MGASLFGISAFRYGFHGLFFCLLGLYWLPQIYHSFVHSAPIPFYPHEFISVTLSRLYLPVSTEVRSS